MPEVMTHLWEVNHPYYCSEGCYFASGSYLEWVHTNLGSWQDFLDEWGDTDLDMNLVFRWDWDRADPDDYEYEMKEDPDFELPPDYLKVYFYLQRKAYGHSVYVEVTEEDESAVREWLKVRAEHMRSLWEPLLDS